MCKIDVDISREQVEMLTLLRTSKMSFKDKKANSGIRGEGQGNHPLGRIDIHAKIHCGMVVELCVK